MGKKTILIVPPQGKRIRAFRIRLSVAVLIFALVCIGFAGYFIPFNSFTLDVVEQNQHRNLADQNKKLLQRILMTLRLFTGLKDQVARLDQKRDHVAGVIGFTYDNKTAQHHKRKGFSTLDPAALLTIVSERERQFQMFASGDSNIFTRIPVCKPIFGKSVISKRFGMCKDPFTGKEKNHTGVDFVAEPETPVIATASGTVSRVETDPIWGKRITIEHSNGFKTVYAHLGSVKVGQGRQVKRGEVIALVGLSGLTTGPHVHYEIWRDGQLCNPEDYLFPSIDSMMAVND